MPGVFIPWLMVFDWHLVAMFQGADRLREASGAEKTFYLGFSMIASGLLTAIAWSSLLPDHRDTLILGALPVKPRTVVSAKLAALAGYIAIVAVSMHAMAAFFFGAILSTNSPFLFLVRGMVAHFVASCAASAAVALWVAAAQGVTLAIVGPRLFARLTTALQAGLVALIDARPRRTSHDYVIGREHRARVRQRDAALDPLDAAGLVSRLVRMDPGHERSPHHRPREDGRNRARVARGGDRDCLPARLQAPDGLRRGNRSAARQQRARAGVGLGARRGRRSAP